MSTISQRGIANLHSHAFQRAMAGLAERRLHPTDSFWTWRETMYHMASRFTPEDLHAVASQLYVEMLRAGYTTVCEFHYVHHRPDGRPYANSLAMSEALLQAAQDTGIRLTLLPVLYMTAGMDGAPLSERQRRFGHTTESYLRDWFALQGRGAQLGCAFHSLRAVPANAMRDIYEALPATAPLHIHIAEQAAEVDSAMQHLGARPVRWLLGQMPVDSRWTLVHATHLDEGEIRDLAASRATVAICPTTEANLGDGIFAAAEYFEQGGRWGIGSDSHISVSPIEELRWLEYAQRLTKQRRTVLCSDAEPRNAQLLLQGVAESAATATGYTEHELAADTVELDGDSAILTGATAQDLAQRWVFSGNANIVRHVTVNGTRVIEEGRHLRGEPILAAYRQVMQRLLA